jgi:5-carboxymethyl-2-hydroxymuconate isomerase
MPHIVTEHSGNFDSAIARNLAVEVNRVLKNCGEDFNTSACKSRAISYQNYVMGEDEKNRDFVHITLSILTGRNKEARAKVAKMVCEKIAAELEKYKKDNDVETKTDLTVYVEELDRDIHQKIIF